MPGKGSRKRATSRNVKQARPNGGRGGAGASSAGQSQRATTTDVSDPTSAPAAWPRDVVFLSAHSQASSRLPPRLAQQLCVAPRVIHPCHPFSIRAHGWTFVKAITVDTPCREPYVSPMEAMDALTMEADCETQLREPRAAQSITKKKPYRHPALGQCGLFARRDIPARTLVVAYLGSAHLATPDDEDPESCYDAAIEVDGVRCGIDATAMGSEARFVNDYRGILERANLFFDDWKAAFPRDVVVPVSTGAQTGDAEEAAEKEDGAQGPSATSSNRLQPCEPPSHVCGLALYSGAHPIKAGTELCASYGKGYWAARRQQASAS